MSTKTQQEKLEKAMRKADAFVAQLARDLFVARMGAGPLAGVIPLEKVAHEAMDAAVAYFEALQTFRKPAPALEQAPVDANGSPVELEG